MTIYKEILGNIYNRPDLKDAHAEKVFLTSDDQAKKVIVAKTDHDREIGIQLKDKSFQDGDILEENHHGILYVVLETTAVLAIKAKTIQEMAIIAHNLGNRHSPAQFENNVMYVPYDYLIEEYLQSQGVDYEKQDIKLREPFRHVDGAK